MHKTLGLCLLLAGLAWGQDKPPELKSYKSVIGSEAKTEKGIFSVHRVGEKLYFEIPKAALNRDFLLVTQVARSKAYVGYGGDPIDQRVVRWVRRDNRVMLEGVDYTLWAEPGQNIHRGVQAANANSILFAFNVESEGPGDSVVIEVSKMYLSDSVELSPKYFVGGRSLERDRCYLETTRAYPENIEVESTLTVSKPKDGGAGPGMQPGTATVRMHYSMVLLPAQPMRPRLKDLRVGYFSVQQYDYGKSDHNVKAREYIRRWRLEKKDPAAALSEPVKPITFYIDPATPKQWVPYIRKGVEAWRPAFEEAGFQNAIVAKDAPGTDWSAEDARYSTIRWLPSPIKNAYGPTVCDPRSGEILEADIHMFHNILDLLRSWYLVQAGPLDPRCRSLPLADELMGELLAMVVTHEVGHSLGLPHNMKASSQYPVEKIRNPQWAKTMGHTPTLMDYSRFNYVAQPEDKIDPADLLPKVGPYDKFAIMWGYKPIPGARTAEAEKDTLDKWARQQDKTAWLRFSTPGSERFDPGDQTEAVGDADPVAATRLGMKNLQRVSRMLVNSTSHYGEPYEDLRQMWDAMLVQYLIEMNHVAQLVGGVYTRQKHAGQNGPLYTVVPATKQKEAVQFLLHNAFDAPAWLEPGQVVQRLAPTGGSRRVHWVQSSLLASLLQSSRLERLAEQAQQSPHAYSAAMLLEDLRTGLFAELYRPGKVTIAPLRRQLQGRWVDIMTDLNRHSGEVPGLAHYELRQTLQDLRLHRKKGGDVAVQAHMDKLQDTIVRQLDPHALATAPRPVHNLYIPHEHADHNNCWNSLPDLDTLIGQP